MLRIPARAGRWLVVGAAAALAAALYELRDAVSNSNEGVTHLYTLPVAMIAVEFGAVAGLAAGAFAVGLFGIWDATTAGVDVPPIGYVTRAVAFLLLGGVLGRFASDRRALEERLRALADRDPLTGLTNARGLEEEVNRHLARAAHEGDRGALMFIDLDGFKTVNDVLGHRCGDEVLRTIGSTLRQAVRPGDVVARVGGDEFIVVLPHATPDAAIGAAERMAHDLERAVDPVDGHAVPVAVSVGVAAFDGRTERGAGGVIAAADAAMYDAKRSGDRIRMAPRTGAAVPTDDP